MFQLQYCLPRGLDKPVVAQRGGGGSPPSGPIPEHIHSFPDCEVLSRFFFSRVSKTGMEFGACGLRVDMFEDKTRGTRAGT